VLRCANCEVAVGVDWEVKELLSGCMEGELVRHRIRKMKEARRKEPV